MDWVFFTVFAGLMAAAVYFRRRINDPDNTVGRWFEERVRPRFKEAATIFSLITILAWAVLYLSAPEEGRDDLSERLKTFFQSDREGIEKDRR